LLKAGFAKGEADMVIRDAARPSEYDRVGHLGDSFGKVFASDWNHNKNEAMILLSAYLYELREGHLLSDKIEPPIRLDEVLEGLEPALVEEFGDYDEVITKARREFRRFYVSDPNK
jgi:hypothetical protein